MRGIETALWGMLGKDPELSKPWTSLNVAVVVVKADDGSEVSPWVRVAVFGDAAMAICERARKGDTVYAEGNLTLDTWQAADGKKRCGLSVMAWRCERVSNIGKAREKRESGDAPGGKKLGSNDDARHDRPFNDPLPF